MVISIVFFVYQRPPEPSIWNRSRTVLRDGTARIFDAASGRSLRTFRENGWLSDAALAVGDDKLLWPGAGR